MPGDAADGVPASESPKRLVLAATGNVSGGMLPTPMPVFRRSSGSQSIAVSGFNRLEYREVTLEKGEDGGENILLIEVRGKRGVGYCKSAECAVHPFERLVRRNKRKPTDLIFPPGHKKQLNRVLADCGLKTDREGNQRSAYSLRHTSICLRLPEGADIYQIGKNCRTSVEMIKKHYAVHLKNTLDAKAINVKPRRAVAALAE